VELLQAAAAQRIWPGRTSCRCVSAKQQSTALEIVSARMGRRLDAIGLAYRQLGLDEATGRDQVFEHLVLPVAAWLGIVFPYHPHSFRWRWQHRRSWRTHLRWAVLVCALLLRAVDRYRHPEPRCSTRPLRQGAWTAAHVGPVRHLGRGRLPNSPRSCRDRSLGGASALGLADPPTGRLPRQQREGLTAGRSDAQREHESGL
jgi:hypothetical protein